jgi:hypothetical protein
MEDFNLLSVRVLGFNSWWGLGVFLFITVYRTALGPIQPPIQWIPGVLSLGVKWPGHETVCSPPSSAEVKNAWFTPPWHSADLNKKRHRDNFTFTFCLKGRGHLEELDIDGRIIIKWITEKWCGKVLPAFV